MLRWKKTKWRKIEKDICEVTSACEDEQLATHKLIIPALGNTCEDKQLATYKLIIPALGNWEVKVKPIIDQNMNNLETRRQRTEREVKTVASTVVKETGQLKEHQS